MSEVIFKYQLQIIQEQEIEMPAGAEILDIQLQNGKICLWAKIFDGSSKVNRVFEMILTGASIPIISQRRIHLKTIQLDGYVLHFFEHKDH